MDADVRDILGQDAGIGQCDFYQCGLRWAIGCRQPARPSRMIHCGACLPHTPVSRAQSVLYLVAVT